MKKYGLLVGLLVGVTASALAQPVLPARPVLVINDRAVAWPQGAPTTDPVAAALAVVEQLQRDGYYFAQFTDVHADTVRIDRGPAVTLGAVEWSGLTIFTADEVNTRMTTRPGAVLNPDVLASDVDALLKRYERTGFPLTQVRTEAVLLEAGPPPTLRLRLTVEEGPMPVLGRVRLVGAGRTSEAFVRRTLGLKTGKPLRGYDPEALRRRLEATGLFRRVSSPSLELTSAGEAVLVLEVDEEPPGAFDLVMGYQPPAGDGRGQLVGNGHLLLKNVLGGGRSFGLKLNRLPGQVSRTDVRASDPFVAGRPVRVDLRFEGYQRDSTYGRQAFSLETGYTFAEHAEAFVRLSRVLIRPGVASGANTVPRADAWFGGVGLRYTNVDVPANPRRGLYVSTLLEQGRKGRLLSGAASTVSPQQRFEAEARVYVPLFRRYTLVGGVEARVVRAETYDESDLYRLGGFASLRGYDEERFVGHAVGRALAEARLLLDRTSYLFVFSDLGYVRRPAFNELPGADRLAPGFGLGMQYRTGLGTLVVSYAVNPDDGLTNGRIHAGISLGL